MAASSFVNATFHVNGKTGKVARDKLDVAAHHELWFAVGGNLPGFVSKRNIHLLCCNKKVVNVCGTVIL